MSSTGSVVGGCVLDLTRPLWEPKFRPVPTRAIGTARVPERKVLVVADPDRPGQTIAHREGRFSDDPAPCGAGYGHLAPADAHKGRWCQDTKCAGAFPWFGAQ